MFLAMAEKVPALLRAIESLELQVETWAERAEGWQRKAAAAEPGKGSKP
jgi:hypothetical protein